MPVCATCGADQGRSISDSAFLCAQCWQGVPGDLGKRYQRACNALRKMRHVCEEDDPERERFFAQAVDLMGKCKAAARDARERKGAA